MADFSRVSVTRKFHSVSEPKKLSNEKYSTREESKPADTTGAIRTTLREESIYKVQNNQHYPIIDAQVRTYIGEKYYYLVLSSDR